MEPVRYLLEVKEPRQDWSLLVSVIAFIAVISSFTCKRGNKVCFVLTLSSRLYAFQNKGIFDRRLTTTIMTIQILQ